ncbi:restriction endonuclease [Nocardioides sp.]|uniref:restriction endonuclease n=1 Tax=Nocardioides sp. TaxID=35761 RepID=UPI002618EEEE|nr:restriction endonuclease [Nocardioides sp.]
MTGVPTWDQYMAPCLRALEDGQVKRSREIVQAAADLLGVTPEQRAIMIPSGQEQWVNRGNWALSYLARATAVERTARGRYRITDAGRDLLAKRPDRITEKDLRALSGDPNAPHTFKAFSAPGQSTPVAAVVADETSKLDPEEQIEAGVARIHADIADQLLKRILGQEPVFFEQAVLDLLMAMGFGGADGKATRTQLAGDGGIDGIVDQDALGLSRIYVQAKRYASDNVVGRPAIQAFVGALAGNQANQGVFITTSRFSAEATSFAQQVPTRIVLIDGERLTRLMIRYGVGVQVKRTVQLVEVDEDFFE